MEEGDIFFWRWKDQSRHQNGGPFGSYHCKSQKAVVKNGVLRDTYWHGNDNYRPHEADCILEYKGNINDLREIRPGEVDYYEREDVVDMRHPNSSTAKIYVKPDAIRSARAMKEIAEYQIARFQSSARWAEQRIEDLNRAIEQIDAGELDNIYLPVCQ